MRLPENLGKILPSSQKASKAISDLIESRDRLQGTLAKQVEQINEQNIQLDQLKAQLEQFKPVPDDLLSSITEVIEKNNYTEAAIKHQTNTLDIQSKQIVAIETKLEQLQLLDKSLETSKGRILVVERKERRKESLSWFGRMKSWLREKF